MSLTKKDIVKNIVEVSSIKTNQSKQLLECFIQAVVFNLEDQKIKIKNFGTFNKNWTPERIGRNPKTMKEYSIGSKRRISFIASNKLKENLIRLVGMAGLNRRPLHPHASALPDCATSRIIFEVNTLELYYV